MEASPEKVGAELLQDLDKRKTPDCLSLAALGQYIEHTLPSEERDGVENHLKSCLYCLSVSISSTPCRARKGTE